MISKAPTVDAFLETVPSEERAVFVELRKHLTADKRVVESMAYRMPTYQIGEINVGAMNKQRQYLCLYLMPEAIEPHRAELKAAKLDCGKSCIRFKKPEQLPLKLAVKMIKSALKLAKA